MCEAGEYNLRCHALLPSHTVISVCRLHPAQQRADGLITPAGMAGGMGIWLLFATGTPRHVSSAVLAANLPLVLSILWALVNHLSAAPALAYAIGIRRQPLAALSGLLMVHRPHSPLPRIPHLLFPSGWEHLVVSRAYMCHQPAGSYMLLKVCC